MNPISVLVALLLRPSAAWTGAVVLGSLGAWLVARAYARPARSATTIEAAVPTDPLALWDLGRRTGRWAPFLGRAHELLTQDDPNSERPGPPLRALARLERSIRRAEREGAPIDGRGPHRSAERRRDLVDRALASAAPSSSEGAGP